MSKTKKNDMRYILFPILLSLMILISFVSSQKTNAEKAVASMNETPNSCPAPIHSGLLKGKIKGMSLVAPPNPFSNNPIDPMKALGLEWIACLPYAAYKKNEPEIYPAASFGGWWGERPEGVCETVRLAKEQGLKVMIKPQMWTHNQWTGDLDFETEKDWLAFEKSYAAFILDWAIVADSVGADLFCIGTELRNAAEKRTAFWYTLIEKVRLIYKGKLTYASNWDDYERVAFWDKLDYIGTDAYFPLSTDKTPSVCDLKEAWEPILQKLKKFSKKWDKPILFTEYGYLSLDGCADKTWELEKKRERADINELAQSNAVQALLETFGAEPWWAGGFMWKWYSNFKSAAGEGHWDRDYTPQGKVVEKVLKKMNKD